MESNLNLRILSGVPLLNKLSDSEVSAVAAQMQLKSFKKDAKIIAQSSTGTEFYIIKSGECIAQQTQEDGKVKNETLGNLSHLPTPSSI